MKTIVKEKALHMMRAVSSWEKVWAMLTRGPGVAVLVLVLALTPVALVVSDPAASHGWYYPQFFIPVGILSFLCGAVMVFLGVQRARQQSSARQTFFVPMIDGPLLAGAILLILPLHYIGWFKAPLSAAVAPKTTAIAAPVLDVPPTVRPLNVGTISGALAVRHVYTVTVNRSNVAMLWNNARNICTTRPELACQVLMAHMGVTNNEGEATLRVRLPSATSNTFAALALEGLKVVSSKTVADDRVSRLGGTAAQMNQLKTYIEALRAQLATEQDLSRTRELSDEIATSEAELLELSRPVSSPSLRAPAETVDIVFALPETYKKAKASGLVAVADDEDAAKAAESGYGILWGILLALLGVVAGAALSHLGGLDKGMAHAKTSYAKGQVIYHATLKHMAKRLTAFANKTGDKPADKPVLEAPVSVPEAAVAPKKETVAKKTADSVAGPVADDEKPVAKKPARKSVLKTQAEKSGSAS